MPQVPALPAHFNPEPELREQLGRRPGAQRCVEGNEELLLIVRDVPKASGKGTSIFFWRRHDGRWTQAGGLGLNELGVLLDRYEEAIGSRQAVVGQSKSASEIITIARSLGPLEVSVRELAMALGQALSFEPGDREMADHADRAVEIQRTAEWLHEDARMTLDFLQTQQSELMHDAVERLEHVLKRLAVIVTLFVPLMAVVMLLESGSSLSTPVKIIAWVVMTAAVVLAGGLLGIRRKR